MGPMATALVLYTGIAPHTTWPWLLLGQAALIVAGAVFINLWLRRSVFDPLQQLTEQVHHAAHNGIHPTIEPIRSSVLTPVSDAVVTISQELARSRRETHKAMALSATAPSFLRKFVAHGTSRLPWRVETRPSCPCSTAVC
jgi:hypothetical protein